MMIKEGPNNHLPVAVDKGEEQYAELLKQERHSYSQALMVDMLCGLFSFCDHETLEQAKSAFPRFQWVYANKAATYRALIGRYFPFLERTQPLEFQENPQQLFLETIKKLCKILMGNHASSNDIPIGDILDALEGNAEKIKTQYLLEEYSFATKMVNSVLSFCGIKKGVNEDARQVNFIKLLLAYKAYLTTHNFDNKPFSIEQILGLRKMALFFGNLDLLQKIVRAYDFYIINPLGFAKDLNDAAIYGHTHIVLWILEGPFVEYDKQYSGQGYSLNLSWEGHPEALKLIFDRCFLSQSYYDSVLINNAKMKSRFAIIEHMFSLPKKTCSFSPKTYLQALEIAFYHKQLEIVDFLLSKREYVDAVLIYDMDPKLAEYLAKKTPEKNKPLLGVFEQGSQKKILEKNQEAQADPTLTTPQKRARNLRQGQ